MENVLGLAYSGARAVLIRRRYVLLTMNMRFWDLRLGRTAEFGDAYQIFRDFSLSAFIRTVVKR